MPQINPVNIPIPNIITVRTVNNSFSFSIFRSFVTKTSQSAIMFLFVLFSQKGGDHVDFNSTSLLQNVYERVDSLIPISEDAALLKTRTEILNAAIGTAIAIEEWEKLRNNTLN